jgi:hypothetical protein
LPCLSAFSWVFLPYRLLLWLPRCLCLLFVLSLLLLLLGCLCGTHCLLSACCPLALCFLGCFRDLPLPLCCLVCSDAFLPAFVVRCLSSAFPFVFRQFSCFPGGWAAPDCPCTLTGGHVTDSVPFCFSSAAFSFSDCFFLFSWAPDCPDTCLTASVTLSLGSVTWCLPTRFRTASLPV